ncbi:MAG TPA: hypothetical protein VLF71_05240 [Candidatus Saccharimonadales bacterium]|nr:hypothetical protein [Candidatus Saccharimonadales bacterium]
MEKQPKPINDEPRQNITPENPSYSWWAQAEKDRRGNARRWANERLKRMRNRLSALLAMSHGAVEMTLRSERSPRVRRQVRQDLQKRYGEVKRPSVWSA